MIFIYIILSQILLIYGIVPPLSPCTYTFSGTSGEWNNINTWTYNASCAKFPKIPTIDDYVIIPPPSTYIYATYKGSQYINITGYNAYAKSIDFGYSIP